MKVAYFEIVKLPVQIPWVCTFDTMDCIMIALGLWIAHIVDCINYLWSFALLQQDHDMTNHILACCGS